MIKMLFFNKFWDETEQIVLQVNVALCLSITLHINRLAGQYKFLLASHSDSSMYLDLGLQSKKGLRTVYSNILLQECNTEVLFKTDHEISYLKLS